MIYCSPARKQELIADMMKLEGCTATQARDYLIAEEWIIVEAVTSFRGDARLEAELAK